MDANDTHKKMMTLANIFWEQLRVDSVQKLENWQELYVIPADEEERLSKNTNRTQSEELRLAMHYLSSSLQLVHDVISRSVPKDLREAYALNPQSDAVIQSSHQAVVGMASIGLWVQDCLRHAFNPTGRAEYAEEAKEAARRATKELIQESKTFKLKDADSYYEFAVNVLSCHLPREYVKLLHLEHEKQISTPDTGVEVETIDLSTSRLIGEIAKGHRRAGG
jgi:hypothetical protein